MKDQVCPIIIAGHNLDKQTGAVERVDIYHQSLALTGVHTLTPSSPRVIPGDDGGADLDTGAGAGDLAGLVVTPGGGHHVPRDHGGAQTQPSNLRL